MEKEKLEMSKYIIALLWLLALVFGCMACAESTDVILKDDGPEAAQPTEGIRWQDYNGKKLGVIVGPIMENAAKQLFQDSEYLLLNGYPDCITALLSRKIDAFLADEPEMISMHAEQPDIDYFHERLAEKDYCFAFRKNDPKSAALCQELNDFIARSRANGTMQELTDIWMGTDEDKKIVELDDLTGVNGTVKVVTTSTDMPFSYIKDGKNVGYDSTSWRASAGTGAMRLCWETWISPVGSPPFSRVNTTSPRT